MVRTVELGLGCKKRIEKGDQNFFDFFAQSAGHDGKIVSENRANFGKSRESLGEIRIQNSKERIDCTEYSVQNLKDCKISLKLLRDWGEDRLFLRKKHEPGTSATRSTLSSPENPSLALRAVTEKT